MKNVKSAVFSALICVGSAAMLNAQALGLACPGSTGQVGVPYVGGPVASGGTPPFTYSIVSGTLPPGLGPLNASTGSISGTPTGAGSFDITFEVRDSLGATATTGAAGCPIVISSGLATGCPEDQGFWNNARNWPVVTTAVTIDGVTFNTNQSMVIGGTTYTQAQLLLIMPHGRLHTGGYVNALSQLVAAVLNLAAGAQPTSTIDTVIVSINTALTGQPPFIIGNALNPAFPASLRALLLLDEADLDAYNSAVGLNCTPGSGLNIP